MIISLTDVIKQQKAPQGALRLLMKQDTITLL